MPSVGCNTSFTKIEDAIGSLLCTFAVETLCTQIMSYPAYNWMRTKE